MSDLSDTCEWGFCDRRPEYVLVFTDPPEQVAYCERCVREAKLALEYEDVTRL